MNIYKKLVNNSLIFALGNLGTNLIVFFLVPLYTYYLTKSEYGIVDLLTTTISFLIPIFTLSIFDSVLRFTMDKKYDKQAILINSLVVIFIGFVVLLILYPAFIKISHISNYIPYFYLLLLIQSIYTNLNQYIRAKGMVKLYALSGIVNAIILLVCNLIFLMLFNMGIAGYMISICIANVLGILFVVIVGKISRDFNLKRVNINLMKEMLQYCIPLIPNALMWWIMSLSDRYIIMYFLGLSANGAYAVANKIPSILSIVNSIFFQAWQLSAIEEANSKNKSEFFSNVFNVFSIVMLLTTSLLLVNLKLILKLFVADNYFEAWRYVPFLLLGAVFSSYSGFLGTNYIAAKKTVGVFKTSLFGAITNILVNLMLIPFIGVNGASIGTMISFFVIWLMRIRDTKGFVNIKVNFKKIMITFLIIYIQIGVLYLNLSFEYILQIGLFISIIFVNFNVIIMLTEKIKAIIFKKYKPSL